MEVLKVKLESLIAELSQVSRDKLKDRLDNLVSVYPFNEYEFMISGPNPWPAFYFLDLFENRTSHTHFGFQIYLPTPPLRSLQLKRVVLRFLYPES